MFFFVLDGAISVESGERDRQGFAAEESFVLSPGDWSLGASRDSEILCVTLPISS
jgi:hypothetical protein